MEDSLCFFCIFTTHTNAIYRNFDCWRCCNRRTIAGDVAIDGAIAALACYVALTEQLVPDCTSQSMIAIKAQLTTALQRENHWKTTSDDVHQLLETRCNCRLHGATAGYTVQLQATRCNCRLHGATAGYTAQLRATRRNCRLHGATAGYTAQLQATRCNCRLHGATAGYTVQLQATLRNCRLHGVTAGYTAQLQATRRNCRLHGVTLLIVTYTSNYSGQFFEGL